MSLLFLYATNLFVSGHDISEAQKDIESDWSQIPK